MADGRVREWVGSTFYFHCSAGHWVTSTNEGIEERPCPAWFGDPGREVGELCTGTLSESYVPGWVYRKLLSALLEIADQPPHGERAQALARSVVG